MIPSSIQGVNVSSGMNQGEAQVFGASGAADTYVKLNEEKRKTDAAKGVAQKANLKDQITSLEKLKIDGHVSWNQHLTEAEKGIRQEFAEKAKANPNYDYRLDKDFLAKVVKFEGDVSKAKNVQTHYGHFEGAIKNSGAKWDKDSEAEVHNFLKLTPDEQSKYIDENGLPNLRKAKFQFDKVKYYHGLTPTLTEYDNKVAGEEFIEGKNGKYYNQTELKAIVDIQYNAALVGSGQEVETILDDVKARLKREDPNYRVLDPSKDPSHAALMEKMEKAAFSKELISGMVSKGGTASGNTLNDNSKSQFKQSFGNGTINTTGGYVLSASKTNISHPDGTKSGFQTHIDFKHKVKNKEKDAATQTFTARVIGDDGKEKNIPIIGKATGMVKKDGKWYAKIVEEESLTGSTKTEGVESTTTNTTKTKKGEVKHIELIGEMKEQIGNLLGIPADDVIKYLEEGKTPEGTKVVDNNINGTKPKKSQSAGVVWE